MTPKLKNGKHTDQNLNTVLRNRNILLETCHTDATHGNKCWRICSHITRKFNDDEYIMEGSNEQCGSLKEDEIKIDVKIRNIRRKEGLANSIYTELIETKWNRGDSVSVIPKVLMYIYAKITWG